MLQAVRESDAWGADVHYVSHTNAANGGVRGYRPMIYPGSGGGRKLAACILKYRRKIYDQPIRLSESSVWYELRAPAAVSFYEEHVFHDNASDAQWFHSHLGAIAEATCRGLCEYFGIPYRAPGTAKPSPAPTIRKEEQVTVELRMLKRGMEGRRRPERHAADEGQGVLPLRHPPSVTSCSGPKWRPVCGKCRPTTASAWTVSWGPPVGAICWGDKDKVRAHSLRCVL